MLTSYLYLNFEGDKKTDISRYANGNYIRLINLEPNDLFSIFWLTTSIGKHLEDISHAHIVSVMHKLLTSRRSSDDLSMGCNRSRIRRPEELTNNKTTKGKYQVRILLKDVFGFAEAQEKATNRLGYKLKLTRNKDEAVLVKVVCTVDARKKIDHIHWYVPHYSPSIQHQAVLSKQILLRQPRSSDMLNDLFQ